MTTGTPAAADSFSSSSGVSGTLGICGLGLMNAIRLSQKGAAYFIHGLASARPGLPSPFGRRVGDEGLTATQINDPVALPPHQPADSGEATCAVD
jgi:hypothetical protein